MNGASRFVGVHKEEERNRKTLTLAMLAGSLKWPEWPFLALQNQGKAVAMGVAHAFDGLALAVDTDVVKAAFNHFDMAMPLQLDENDVWFAENVSANTRRPADVFSAVIQNGRWADVDDLLNDGWLVAKEG